MKDDENVETTGQSKDKRDQNKKSKSGGILNKVQKTKSAHKIIKFIIEHFSIFITILIILLIIILVIGIYGFLTSLPGMWLETANEWKKNLWGDLQGFVTGDNITSTIGEEEQIQLAQHIQEMGYDILGYGFADVKYKYDDENESKQIDGHINRKIIEINKSIDGRNYLQAYIAQSEAIYVPSTQSLMGFFKSTFNNIQGIIDNIMKRDSIPKSAKAYSTGMLNITGNNLNDLVKDISINREEELLKISINRTLTIKDTYYFNLANWTSRYGKPLELFLALHLGTMMPDLSYDLATEDAFNTKVNINLQLVNATYKVIFDKNGEGQDNILQEDIERAYLKVMCNMSEEEINRFSDEGVLDDAFEKLLGGRKNYPEYRLDLYDGAVVDTTISDPPQAIGTNLAEVEQELLGQKYSTYNIIEIRERTIINELMQEVTEKYEVEVVQDKILRCKDLSKSEDENSARSEFENTVMSGLTINQTEAFSKLILDGRKKSITYLPRITTVDNHWYYSYVNFVYGQASKAKKRMDYMPEDEENDLSTTKLNGGKIILDQTFVAPGGVYYQLCEPEVNGPNEAVIALFKGGSGTFNGVPYNFPGSYYRYDGTRATALRIANAKANDEQKSTFEFQNTSYDTADRTNKEWEIEKEEVTFATEDEQGNKSYTDAFTAFAILENMHTLEAESVYRNLKDLLTKLKYFSKANFTKPLIQVLEWPIESVGSNNIEGKDDYATKGITRDENEYGLILKSEEAFNLGENIIAPGDATVESVDGNTIKIKFKTISSVTIQDLEEKFGSDYESVDPNIILDMEMTITGINPSISVGDTIKRGQTIGQATTQDIQIILSNIDKSFVEDIETYMYPTYKATEEDDFLNEEPNSGQNGADGNYEGNGEYGDSTFDPDYVLESISERQLKTYRALREAGCTKAGACGAMGNIQLESNFDPNAKNPNSTAYGIVQWLYGSGRRQKMEEYCRNHGYPYNSFDGQLGFFLEEVRGYTTVWNKLTTSDDVIECADIFARKYEVCTDGLSQRKTYANAFMKQMAD